MPGTKEIRVKIASVKSTQKITKAMQMVATSKMRRAQERMRLARPYAAEDPLGHRQPDAGESGLPASVPAGTQRREERRRHRDLLGSRPVRFAQHQHLQAGADRDARLAGQGREHLDVPHRRQGHGVLPPPAESRSSRTRRASAICRTSRTSSARSRSCSTRTRKARSTACCWCTRRFVNTMTQKPDAMQLLPVEPIDGAELQEHWDYIYEPGADEILDGLLMRYIESTGVSRRRWKTWPAKWPRAWWP